jgi:UPF0042 nucleotide-binding protein
MIVMNDEITNKKIIFSSFGFKYGIPKEANFVFDVRFISNPFYIPELRRFSGKDKEVQDFLLSFEETNETISNCVKFLDYIFPVFISSARSINVTIGCTGGRHRSVAFAEWLFSHYKEKYQYLNEDYSYEFILNHRDILIEGEE